MRCASVVSDVRIGMGERIVHPSAYGDEGGNGWLHPHDRGALKRGIPSACGLVLVVISDNLWQFMLKRADFA